MLLATLVVCIGGSFLVENPGGSLMPYYFRWQQFAKITKVFCQHYRWTSVYIYVIFLYAVLLIVYVK